MRKGDFSLPTFRVNGKDSPFAAKAFESLTSTTSVLEVESCIASIIAVPQSAAEKQCAQCREFVT
jgi:hypothetical protein